MRLKFCPNLPFPAPFCMQEKERSFRCLGKFSHNFSACGKIDVYFIRGCCIWGRMRTDQKFVSKFYQLTDISNGRSPGMKEALATLDDSHWQKKGNASPVDPGMRAKIKQIYYGTPVGQWGERAKWVMKATVNDPLALATALPFVDQIQTRRALDIISKVPEGAEMVAEVKSADTKFKLDFFRDGAVFRPYSADMKVGSNGSRPPEIAYTAFAARGERVSMLLHEFQHFRQYKAGLLSIDRDMSPIEQMWYNRAYEADAEATAVDISYKLKLAGEKDAWKFLSSRESLSCSAMARAYEAEVRKDPNALYDGRAKRAAYDTWFQATTKADHTISSIYNRQGLGRAGAWHRPGNGDTAPVEPKILGRADIEKLGALSRVNYMTLPGHRSMEDVFYRKPDWNAAQAKQLANFQGAYQQKALTNKAGMALRPPAPKFSAPQPSPPKGAKS